MSPRYTGPELVINVRLYDALSSTGVAVPVIGTVSHPLAGVDVCEVIRRLAPVIPPDLGVTWYVNPGYDPTG